LRPVKPMTQDTIKIQLTFTEQTSHGEFRDALYFTQEEYAELKPEDLEKRKQERIDNWTYQLEHPVAPIELTLNDYIESRNNLMKEIERCSDKIDELGTVENLEVIQAEYEAKVQKIKDKIANK
jgi:hypothetical protein